MQLVMRLLLACCGAIPAHGSWCGTGLADLAGRFVDRVAHEQEKILGAPFECDQL